MASGFFALFDDISVLMDDIAVMTKVAGKKTAGVLGDDLAVNANKASGFASSRELPVLWEITKGSFVNKLIILPIVFALNYYLPQVIIPILIIGGLYLSYEGVEKIYEWIFHKQDIKKNKDLVEKTKEEILKEEKKKIKSAIITDFILSLEIVIVALGTVLKEPFLVQIVTVTIIAILATIGVYGLVALIVRLDDIGIYIFEHSQSTFSKKFGSFLVSLLPKIVKSLSIIGTFAMLLVAGSIFLHNIHLLHENLKFLPTFILELVIGFVTGMIILLMVKILTRVFKSN